jgi:hypothetical protein
LTRFARLCRSDVRKGYAFSRSLFSPGLRPKRHIGGIAPEKLDCLPERHSLSAQHCGTAAKTAE